MEPLFKFYSGIQVEGVEKNTQVEGVAKNTRDVFWYIEPTISPNPKLQSATKKKSYPANHSCPPSPVASMSLPPHAVSEASPHQR
jgi:hypothetical protein